MRDVYSRESYASMPKSTGFRALSRPPSSATSRSMDATSPSHAAWWMGSIGVRGFPLDASLWLLASPVCFVCVVCGGMAWREDMLRWLPFSFAYTRGKGTIDLIPRSLPSLVFARRTTERGGSVADKADDALACACFSQQTRSTNRNATARFFRCLLFFPLKPSTTVCQPPSQQGRRVTSAKKAAPWLN